MSYANYEGQERVLTDLTVVLSGSLYLLLRFFATVLSTDRPDL